MKVQRYAEQGARTAAIHRDEFAAAATLAEESLEESKTAIEETKEAVAEAAATLATAAATKRKSNPRFAATADKPSRQATALIAAMELTKPLPEYAEAKGAEEALQERRDDGRLKKFMDFNLGNNRSRTSKFVSNGN